MPATLISTKLLKDTILRISTVVAEYIRKVNVRVVLVLDEIQDIAKIPDLDTVRAASVQLYELQELFGSGIFMIATGSSLFVPHLFQKTLPASQHIYFAGHTAFQSAQWDKLTAMHYYPIFRQTDFTVAVKSMVNPQAVDYRSADWSLEGLISGGGSELAGGGGGVVVMDVEGGISDSEDEGVAPETLEIRDEMLSMLFALSGGVMRQLDHHVQQLRMLAREKPELPMPSVDARKESIRTDVELSRKEIDAQPQLLQIYDAIFDKLMPLLSRCLDNDAVIFNDSVCDLFQIKMGGSSLTPGDIVDRLKDAEGALRDFLTLLSYTPTIRRHLLTTRLLSEKDQTTLMKSLTSWDRSYLSG
ncbi:hypothetical protein HK097_003860, partial [Rhizophlyctis rosea]